MNSVDAAARLEALGHPTRLDLFRFLVRAGGDGLAVGALQARLGVAPSTLSHHLRTLAQVDLVRRERDGTAIRCSANFALMDDLMAYLMAECCADEAEQRP